MIGCTLAATGILKNPTNRKPMQNMGLGWNMSESVPAMSIKEAKVRVYAERIH